MRSILALAGAAVLLVAQPAAADTLEERLARLQGATPEALAERLAMAKAAAAAPPVYDVDAFCAAAERHTTTLELLVRGIYREWRHLPCIERERRAAEALAARQAPAEDIVQCDRRASYNAATAGIIGASYLVLLGCVDNLAHQRRVDAALREHFRAHR